MKFYNKNPVLRSKWVSIKTPYPYTGYYKEIKIWCQRHQSPGRFYNHGSVWWFENQEDALIVKITWGYNTT